MKKTYKSMSHLMRIVVRVNGNPVNVEFSKAHLGKGIIGSSYTTDNKDLQRAIESNEYFNSSMSPNIWTDDVDYDDIVNPQGTIEIIDAKQIIAETVEPAPIKRGRKPKAE